MCCDCTAAAAAAACWPTAATRAAGGSDWEFPHRISRPTPLAFCRRRRWRRLLLLLLSHLRHPIYQRERERVYKCAYSIHELKPPPPPQLRSGGCWRPPGRGWGGGVSLPIVFSKFPLHSKRGAHPEGKEEKDEGTISCKSRFSDQIRGSLPAEYVKGRSTRVSGREDA